MVGEVRLTRGVQPRNGGHQVVVDPEAAHRVVGGRVDTHRYRVRVFARYPFVHLEQVAVAVFDGFFAVAVDGIGEV